MAAEKHIRAVDRDASKDAKDEAKSADETGMQASDLDAEIDLSEYVEDYPEDDEQSAVSTSNAWIAPSVAVIAAIGWSGFYGWAMRAEFASAASAAPADWIRWIIDWTIPILLLGVVWLIAMRNSRAEAKRFGETAALLSRESQQLEARLTTVNRELSLAREFIGAQSRDLEALGRIASERLSKHANELQSLIQSNGVQVDAIGSASETALGNMTRLRDDLPVIANSARDVSNQVGNAGRTAEEQLEKLVSGFERLNEFGKASETQVQSFVKRVNSSLEGLETQVSAIETAITERLESVMEQTGTSTSEISEAEEKAIAALRERLVLLSDETLAVTSRLSEAGESAIEQLYANKTRFEDNVTQTVEALDRLDQQALLASQNRIKSLHEEANRFDEKLAVRDRSFNEEIAKRQEAFDTREAQATEVLAQRLADLDDAIATRRETQTRETEKLVEQSEQMAQQLDKLSALIGEVAAQRNAAQTGLASGLDTLGEQLARKRSELAETETKLSELTESGIRLLEIIQSGAKHSREDLPEAIETASSALGSVEARATSLSDLMLGTGSKAEDLSQYLIETQTKIETADNSIEALSTKLSEQSEEALAKLQGLRTGFANLAQESTGFAGETQDQLRQSLKELENATRDVFSTLENGAREKVDALAGTLSQRAVAEMERALRNETAETVGKLEQAAAHASGIGREATAQLRDQLTKVNELTKNLEQRIARARELSEEQVGNDFARRMALITDSLNSNSIDIANAISTEVTDTSWDAYLKGDRGIFTRRALRLIESGEAREIADLYQSDEAFKANVSRYIHDFEAMLRSMLSTRDGNALGVTILGSDMGKLYVILAQAIERFRN